MSLDNLSSSITDQLADAMAEARGQKRRQREVPQAQRPSIFKGKFTDTVKGKTFSEAFGEAPPDGLPDLKAPVYSKKDWSPEHQQFIPDPKKFEHYAPDLRVLYRLWVSVLRNNQKALVVGPTGSGKTSLQEYLCSVIKQPYYRINGSGDMESDRILGRPWVSDGSMRFELGEMVKAARDGYWIAFDEPWSTPSPIQMAIQRFYEKDGVFQIDDMPGELSSKLVVSHPFTRLVLADNVIGMGDNIDLYVSKTVQDAATLNRMDTIIFQPYPEPAREKAALERAFPQISDTVLEDMVEFANLCRVSYEQRALSAAVSMRQLLAWCANALDLRSVNTAAAWVFGDRFADDAERATVVAHYRTVFDEELVM